MVELIYKKMETKIIDGNSILSLEEYIGDISIDYETFKYIEGLENQKIEGLRLEEFYLYENIPLYIFNRQSIYIKLREVIGCSIILNNIYKKTEGNLIVNTDNEVMFKLASDVYNVETNMVYEKNISDNKPMSKQYFKLIKRYLKGIKVYSKFLFCKKSKDNLMIISSSANINEVNTGGEKKYIDGQLGDLVKYLKEIYNIINFQVLNNTSTLSNSLKYKEDYVPFEYFILYKKINALRLLQSEAIKDNLKKIYDIDYKYKNHDLKKIVTEYVFKNIKSQYDSFIKEILAAKKFIEKNNVKKCIVIGEGNRGRCFVSACNLLKINAYAIQHGVIGDISPAYIINSNHGNLLVPTVSLLWGEKYKNILMNNTNVYNSKNTVVVGQIRTDYLFNYNCKCNKYDDKLINKEKLKILYATQYFEDLLKPATRILFKALQAMKQEYELIIKLHPGDFYYDFYYNMIKKYNIKNVKIVKDENLYDLLEWCDVVVSVHSTVIIEGALLNKPSICIKLLKYNDLANFVKDGVSLGACDEKELYDMFSLLINQKNCMYKENLKKYIRYNFYKIDGKVTKRIIDVIRGDKNE